MTSNNQLTVQDRVLFNGNGGLIRGTFKVTMGRFELTPTHLIYYQRSRIWMMLGLIGALIGRRTAGKRALDIELARVQTVARGKYGLNKKVLDVTMVDGTAHKITVEKFDDFNSRLKEQLPRACA